MVHGWWKCSILSHERKRGLVSKEAVVLCQWGSEKKKSDMIW